MEIDVCLLTGSYLRELPVVVQFYGRTRDGRSVIVRGHGFEPYFQVLEPSPAHLSLIRASEAWARDEEIHLIVGQKEYRAQKIVVKGPWMVPALRDKLKQMGARLFAVDIPFHLRYIWDNGIRGCNRVRGSPDPGLAELHGVDLALDADEWEAIDPFQPPLTVLSFDIENSIAQGTLLCIGVAVQIGRAEPELHSIVGSERDILLGFEKLVADVDPDVITGYNINNYDIIHLKERAELVLGRGLKVSRAGGDFRRMGTFSSNAIWKTDGRVVVDGWEWARKQLRPKRETLNFVARQLLGETKLEGVDASKMDEEWARDREKVIEYCKRDALLALQIITRLRTVQRNLELAAVAGLPLGEVLASRVSLLIDSILIPEADRQRIAVPMTRRANRGEQPIVGGYVHDIEPGLYPWICTLDFKSMYPSVIIAHNLCFSTKVSRGGEEAPTGIRFLQRDERRGLIPMMLEGLMETRAVAKKNRDDTDDPALQSYYEGLQEAVKVLMNSFFGVMGSSFYRFTDKDIGESITAWARSNIKEIISQLDEEGHDVVYSDTDSIFVKAPLRADGTARLEDVVEFGTTLAERFTREGAELEFEKILNPLFSHGAKKRYVGRVVWPEREILVRGYETRRTDSFDLLTTTLSSLFEKILDGDTEGAVELAKREVRALYEGGSDPEGLVISRSVGRPSDYVNPDGMANVQAARKLIEQGYEFVWGMKVSYVVTDFDTKPMQVEPVMEGRPLPRPDYPYYARRLAEALGRISEEFGWDMDSLMRHAVGQTSLFSFGAAEPATGTEPTEDELDSGEPDDDHVEDQQTSPDDEGLETPPSAATDSSAEVDPSETEVDPAPVRKGQQRLF